MQVDLSVISSTRIKRKKSWQKVTWIGKEKEEIILLHKKRINILQLATGITKHKLSQLDPFISKLILSTISINGFYLAGLLSDGNIFLWHKDSDKVYFIGSIPCMNLPLSNKVPLHLFISPDGSNIIFVYGFSEIYFWQKNFYCFPEIKNKKCHIFGFWYYIEKHQFTILPKLEYRETSIDAVFICDHYFKNCNLANFVFNSDDHICISTCFIQKPFSELVQKCYCLDAKWINTKVPLKDINHKCEPLRLKGSYITKFSRDGRIIAVAVNQFETHCSYLLFFSPFSQSSVCIDLQGCGASYPVRNSSRNYWICDMVWTSDDALLVCCTRQGSICIISRLGGLLLLTAKGDSINLGPSYYLSLIPLVSTFENKELNNEENSLSSTSTDHSLKQRFSISFHNFFPLLIISDGCLVICLQIPNYSVGISNIIQSHLLHGYKIICPIFELYNPELLDFKQIYQKSSNFIKNKFYKNNEIKFRNRIELEKSQLNNILNDTNEDYKNNSVKSLPHTLKTTAILNSTCVNWEEKKSMEAINSFLSVWNLCSSLSHFWTEDMELLCSCAIDGFLKIVQFALNESSTKIQNESLLKKIKLTISKFFSVIYFDIHFNLLSCSLKFICKLVEIFLADFKISVPYIEFMQIAVQLLIKVEKLFKETYSFVTNSKYWFHNNKICLNSSYISIGCLIKNDIINKNNLKIELALNQRLFQTWNFLYQTIIKYYKAIINSQVTIDLQDDVVSLLCTVQWLMQERNYKLFQIPSNRKKHKTLSIYLNGNYEKAIKLWMRKLFNKNNELRNIYNRNLISRNAHRILYTLILYGKLGKSVKFIYKLLSINSKMNKSSILEETQQNDFIKNNFNGVENIAIRKVIKSFVRILAAYFTNRKIQLPYVSSAKSIPSLLESINKEHIYHVINQSDITNQISYQNLFNILTPDATLELFLILGLWNEAIWFILQLGDWQMAFCLAHLYKYLPERYKKKYPLQNCLLPEIILTTKLKNVFHLGTAITENIENSKSVLYKTSLIETSQQNQRIYAIYSFLLPAAFCDINIIINILEELVDELKFLFSNIRILVNSNIYLPAPPLYCPQEINKIDKSEDINFELHLRQRVSDIIHNIMYLFRAANLTVPVVCNYINCLQNIQSLIPEYSIHQLCTIIETLKNEERTRYSFDIFNNDQIGQFCVYIFQLICAVLWMMHVRDNLSQSYRKIQDDFVLSQSNRRENHNYNNIYEDILKWAVCLYPFHLFFQYDNLEHMIINLALELPPSQKIAEYLASIFYTSDNFNINIQKQLNELLEEWKTVKIEIVQENLLTSTGNAFQATEIMKNGINTQKHQNNQISLSKNICNGKGDKNNNILKSLYDIFLFKSQKQKEKFEEFQKISGIYKNTYIFPSFTKKSKFTFCLFPFELENLYVEYLEMFLDINVFKYLNECNSDRLNLPLIPIYAADIQKQIFQSNEHIYLKKNQFIFPIIEELWKTYHWKAECRNKNKKKAKKIYGSELYKKSYSKIQSSSSSIKNSKQNFQCNLVNKKKIIENSSWKALSLISSKQDLQYQSHSFVSCMDSDFEEIQNKIYWLFQWAKTYSLQFLGNDLLDNMPKLKIEVYPVQVLYCLYNLKMNFKFLSSDGKSYDNNEQRKSVEIKTNERENEIADFSENISVCISQEEINVNFKSDLLIEEQDKKLSLCNSLKQSITSLKEQLNNWREKRLSIISNVHSTLNKTLIKDQNDALPEKVKVQLLNNENNDNTQKSQITQNNIDSLQDQNSKNFSSSRVSKFLSLPKIKMKEFEDKVSSECASSLTTVTKLTSENETSVSRNENHKSSCCNKNEFSTSLRMAAVNSNGNYARQISFNDFNNLFTNVNNKTYTNIGIQTSKMQTITNKDDELNYRENRLSFQEILTSTVQQTFRQELRNMAEQMGFRFIAGAIGCISMQSQLLSRNNYTSVNTQTETIETKILKSSKHHDLSFNNSEPNDNQQNLLVNKKSDENPIKNKITENINSINSISNCVCMENDILRHTQNNIKTSEIFKNDKESDNMKYSLKSSHINEEEMDSGKEITPDILDESSAVKILVDSCVDNITIKKNPNLSFKIEEYVNKITSLPFGWTHEKNISEKFIQDKAPVFATLNKKSKQMDKLHYQFLKIPSKTDIFTVPFKTQYELMSHWKVEVKSKNKYSDIRRMLPDLLKSKSIKNENKKFPLLKSSEKNYGPLLFTEEKKSNFNLQKNFRNKPSKNISMKHCQDYLSKKHRSDKITEIKNSPENLSLNNNTQITVNEISSKTDKVLQDQYKKDEEIVKSTKDTVIIQTDQTYTDIQYNVVSQLNLDIKKVDAATTANKIEFKNTETITDEDYFIDNSNIITRDFGIQTTLLSNKNDNFNKVSEKLPVYDDGFKNAIVNEELENIKRSIEEKQKQINNVNLKHILDSLIHEEEQSMDNNTIIPHKNSEVNITNSELKIDSKSNNENKFQNEINNSEFLENNQIVNNESGIIDDDKLETYNKSFVKCEDMKISSRNYTEIPLNNTQDMPENIGINRSKEGLLNGDKLTKEILDGNQKFVKRYVLHFDSDKEKYKIAAKESLNHRLVHMQEKLEEIEKVSNTMKKEINDAQKAVSTMELLDQNYLSKQITSSTYLNKIQPTTLPTAEIRKNNCLYFEVNLSEDANKNLSIENMPAETLPVTQIKHIVNEQNMEIQKVTKQSLETVIEKNDLKRERQLSNFDRRTESAIALLNELVDDKNIYHIKEAQLIKDDFRNKSTKHQLSKKLFNSKKITNKNLKQTKLLLNYQPSNFARKKNFKYSLNNTLSKTMKNKIALINKTQSYMRNSNFEKTDLAASNLEETFIIKSSEDEDFNKVQQKALQSLRKLYDSKYIPLNAQIKYISKKQNTTFKINSEIQSKIPMKFTTELMKHTVDKNKDKNQTFVLKNEKSDSSDNISLWSVPDDIKKILYDSNTTDFNDDSNEVSRLNEEEISIKSDISSLEGN